MLMRTTSTISRRSPTADSTCSKAQLVSGRNLVAAGITFSHAPTSVGVSVDTGTGTVAGSYDGSAFLELATGLTIAAGQNGVGSNNDAYAVDNYSIEDTFVPEPGSLALPGLGGLMLARRRRG